MTNLKTIVGRSQGLRLSLIFNRYITKNLLKMLKYQSYIFKVLLYLQTKYTMILTHKELILRLQDHFSERGCFSQAHDIKTLFFYADYATKSYHIPNRFWGLRDSFCSLQTVILKLLIWYKQTINSSSNDFKIFTFFTSLWVLVS